MTETVRVRHIGTHARRADTMTGTGTMWHGYGDIQPVPAKDWETLKRYPDLWELATDLPPEAPPAAAAAEAAAKASEFSERMASTKTSATQAPSPAPAKKTLGLKR